MSNVSPSQSDFDFWDFVACARCQLPFVSDPGIPPQVPFWLTECGHIVCNSHLNTDQSCAQCGAQGIYLVPLQRDMDAPMSEWFRSLPHTFDSIANAAKFQQETMALQIRYFKDRLQQNRALIDRIKSEIAENKALKKAVEELTRENGELRQHLGFHPAPDQPGRAANHKEPSHFINANGKRQRVEPQQNSNGLRTGTSSSPRSVVTPLGPNRLTLPPGQQAPNFSTRQDGEDGASSHSNPSGNSGTNPHSAQQRPGSSRFVEQYAYALPQTPQFHPPKLAHAQAAPLRQFQRTTASHERDQLQRTMMPPPMPPASRFKPAQGPPLPMSSRQQQNQNVPQVRHRRQMDMGPPAAPQQPQHQPQTFGANPQQGTHHRTQALPASFVNTTEMQSGSALQSAWRPAIVPPSSNRSVPLGSQRFAFPMTSGGTSVPPTASASHRFVAASGPGSRAPSRAANVGTGGQRMPFVPGSQGGFG